MGIERKGKILGLEGMEVIRVLDEDRVGVVSLGMVAEYFLGWI